MKQKAKANNPEFGRKLDIVLDEIRTLLIEKNNAYGDSALNPVRIFSKASATDQILVRIDDKLSRLSKGTEYPGDDTYKDLLGYLIILEIAKHG